MTDAAPMQDLPVDDSLWERVFMVAPLVLIGTREPDGHANLAPKHMAMPVSSAPWFGFVCSPRHATLRNLRRQGAFTVSWPRVDQVVAVSLSASPRDAGQAKPVIASLGTLPATAVDGVLLAGALLHLECTLHQIIDGLGENSLVVGRVVAAAAHADVLQVSDEDPDERLRRATLPVYLHPARFSSVGNSLSFPFPAGFRR